MRIRRGLLFLVIFNVSVASVEEQRLGIEKIHMHFQNYAYVEDFEQFGLKDYWQSPDEFNLRRQGDCEDFAIAKFFELEKFGNTTQQLHYVMTPQGAHMVVSVFDGVERQILDNNKSRIYPLDGERELDFIWGFDRDSVWIGKDKNDSRSTYPMNIEKFKRIINEVDSK